MQAPANLNPRRLIYAIHDGAAVLLPDGSVLGLKDLVLQYDPASDRPYQWILGPDVRLVLSWEAFHVMQEMGADALTPTRAKGAAC